MSKLHSYFKPLTYKQYLPAMFGLWLIAFALGSWLGKDLKFLVAPFIIGGLIVHGLSMHPAHKQAH